MTEGQRPSTEEFVDVVVPLTTSRRLQEISQAYASSDPAWSPSLQFGRMVGSTWPVSRPEGVPMTAPSAQQPMGSTTLTPGLVANYFILKVDEDAGDTMTNLRLQKLVYYAQAWHLALTGEPLFADNFEAWVHGPVIPHLYRKYKGYGWNAIPQNSVEWPQLSDETREILDEVWDTYGPFTAKALETLTHSEDPWRDARQGYEPGTPSSRIIPQDIMRRYYANLRHV